MNKMNLEEFTKVVTEQVAVRMPKKEIKVQDFIKNNGTIYKGILIFEERNLIAPAIYLDKYYKKYQGGVDIVGIVEEIAAAYETCKKYPAEEVDVDALLDFKQMQSRVRFKVVNYNKNIAQYKDIPHRKVLDLMVVYYLNLGTNEMGCASTLINKELFAAWNVTEEELFLLALTNSEKQEGVQIIAMQEILAKLITGNTLEREELMDGLGKIPMLVVTNKSKVNGAGVILYPDCLAQIKKRLHSDFYILPAGLDAVIAIPKTPNCRKEDLLSMVRKVNATEVLPEEILSDNLYCFSNNVLSLITA